MEGNKFNLTTCSICGNYIMNLRNRHNIDWNAEDTSKIYDTLMASIAYYLSITKSKEKKVGFALRDTKGQFKLGGIVEYHKNENEDMQDNWSYVMTFDEADMEDVEVCADINTPDYGYQARNQAFALHGLRFYSNDYYYDMFVECIDTLIEFLDANAREDDVVEVDFPGYFVASVAIEDGKKVFAITPDGAMKRVIKDDAAL